MKYRLAEFGTFFSTRPRGAKVRHAIEDEAIHLAPDEPIILDFAGVEMISFSFADELVGLLLEARKLGGLGKHAVMLTNLESEETEGPIGRSMYWRDLIAFCCDEEREVRLIGAAEHIVQTFTAAKQRGSFRTPELAADLDIKVTTCNNRLKPLLDAGLLARTPTSTSSHGFTYHTSLPC